MLQEATSSSSCFLILPLILLLLLLLLFPFLPRRPPAQQAAESIASGRRAERQLSKRHCSSGDCGPEGTSPELGQDWGLTSRLVGASRGSPPGTPSVDTLQGQTTTRQGVTTKGRTGNAMRGGDGGRKR